MREAPISREDGKCRILARCDDVPGFPGGTSGKESACSVGDLGSISGLGRSPARGHSNPLQYSWWRIPGQKSLVCCSPCSHKESDTIEKLSTAHCERVSHLVMYDSLRPMDCSLPGSSVHGVLQGRILEWAAILYPGDLSDPGIERGSPALQADSLPSEPPEKYTYQFSSGQSLSHVPLFVTPWTAAHQAFLSITNSQSLL